ncbi:MAG: hypothetical protein C5B50_25445 [Verrucomicrobia bacterium]|nr:MAG: hypothetical protein C5B50_25445 [Verrucomicrobiota bacterium]
MTGLIIHRALMVGIAALFLFGCKSSVETGKPLGFPPEKDAKLFAAASVVLSTMTNQYGRPIDGIILQDASLVRDVDDLKRSNSATYVIFWDFLLGNMVDGAYWQQQADKRPGLGIPVMDTHSTKATIVSVNTNRVVTGVKSVRVAHVRISVDTNDFSRVYPP